LKCRKCRSDIAGYLGKHKSQFCFNCDIKYLEKKIAKYSGCNLGLNGLNRDLDEFITVSHYTSRIFKLPRKIVLGLLLVGDAQVYKPDMIYLLKPNMRDEDVISAILKRDNYKCHCCGGQGNMVKYIIEDLNNKKRKCKLVSVCEKCANYVT